MDADKKLTRLIHHLTRSGQISLPEDFFDPKAEHYDPPKKDKAEDKPAEPETPQHGKHHR